MWLRYFDDSTMKLTRIDLQCGSKGRKYWRFIVFCSVDNDLRVETWAK